MIKICKIRFRIALFKNGKIFGSLNCLTIAKFYWGVYLCGFENILGIGKYDVGNTANPHHFVPH